MYRNGFFDALGQIHKKFVEREMSDKDCDRKWKLLVDYDAQFRYVKKGYSKYVSAELSCSRSRLRAACSLEIKEVAKCI